MKDKMKRFSTYILAALACYVSMTQDQQAIAMMYVSHKIAALDKLHAAAGEPGGSLAADLLQNLQQPCNHCK